MPRRAKRPCRKAGCPRLTDRRSNLCLEHEQSTAKARAKEDRERRGSSAKRGYGYRWSKARAQFLKLEPLCRHCKTKNIITMATEVDHIIPHKQNMELFWDTSNWQPLCKSCHSRKTANENK